MTSFLSHTITNLKINTHKYSNLTQFESKDLNSNINFCYFSKLSMLVKKKTKLCSIILNLTRLRSLCEYTI